MSFAQTMSPQSLYREVPLSVSPPQRPRHGSRQRFFTDLSQCLFDFVIQLLPTAEEMSVKEDVRKLLERLIRTIEPDSRLLSFGSTANGFSLRNSDMDLCCLIDSDERLSATDLVTMLGDLLERETKFHVKPLPHARIPIVKLSLDPSPGLPLGIACDIGFENRLALENTRLLMCYALIDPTRVRTMVLFLKVWSKRRKINSPYKGTLSSYGYVLLVIFFLVHVKNPPVLPNLQQMPPLRPIPKEETMIGLHNVWFFDDTELLRQRWQSENTDTVAELLIDFFRYYSRDFPYNTQCASIRAGLLKKEDKGWQNDLSAGRYHDSRERNRLCIEDPFETEFNVGRCVTKDGLYTIRGEFMRAIRILGARPERAILALSELCEERKDEELVPAPPRLSNIPPQTPYTVGSSSIRPKGFESERFSPPTKFFEPGPQHPSPQVIIRPPPEHMAPKRSKWTSPPPPEAPPADHTLFEDQLDKGLELATSSTTAREIDDADTSSSNSEILSDDDPSDAASDDVTSIRSFSEGTIPGVFRRPPTWLMHQTPLRLAPAQVDLRIEPPSIAGNSPTRGPRGRPGRFQEQSNAEASTSRIPSEPVLSSSKNELARRSTSGPPKSLKDLTSSLSNTHTPTPTTVPLPPSPESPPESQHDNNHLPHNIAIAEHEHEQSTVYYQTPPRSRSPIYPSPAFLSHSMPNSPLSQHSSPANLSPYQFPVPHIPYMMGVPHDIYSSNHPPLIHHSLRSPGIHRFNDQDNGRRGSGGLETPTPMHPNGKRNPPSRHSSSPRHSPRQPSPRQPSPRHSTFTPTHAHNLSSSTTITSGPTPPAYVQTFAQNNGSNTYLALHTALPPSPSVSTFTSSPRQRGQSSPCSREQSHSPGFGNPNGNGAAIPKPVRSNSSQHVGECSSTSTSASGTSISDRSSPAESSTGYATSASRSPSPPDMIEVPADNHIKQPVKPQPLKRMDTDATIRLRESPPLVSPLGGGAHVDPESPLGQEGP